MTPIDAALEGSSRSARLFVTPNDEADQRGALVFALDTTEERNREEQLHQSQKMQAVGQLAGGIAHDFNNVLTAIIGYSELLLANHRPTDPSFQDIMQIKQNANRAAGLVRQLLAFSRRQTLRPQVLQLGDVLSELQMLTRRLVGEKIEVDLRQGRDLWLVKADLNQFEQVIINLIVNARDAMPDGGKIFLRTKNVPASECAAYGEKLLPAADYVVVEVEDTGTGIPADIRDKIFDPFFTTKEFGKGTGLGLSMVYGIVKQTGGFIFCDSQVGRGTTFRIFFTRHIPVEEPVEAAQGRGGEESLRRPYRARRGAAGGGRGGRARLRRPRADLARLYRAGGRKRRRRAARGRRGPGTASTWWSPTWSCRKWTARPCSANCASAASSAG